MEVYFFDAVKHPPARLRWEERREACQDRYDHYEEIRQMTNKIVDQSGVVQNGPDDPALALAQARQEGERSVEYLAYGDDCRRRGEQPLAYADWAEGQMPEPEPWRRAASGGLLGASVGAVDRRQAGILPSGGVRVTDEMIYRAQTEIARHENPLGASAIRATLEAALRA